MSRLSTMIEEKLRLIIKYLIKDYPKIFSIIVSLALITYFSILLKGKFNKKEVPINKPSNTRDKFSGNSFPNKKCKKKSHQKKAKNVNKKKQKNLGKGNPSNETSQEEKERTIELKTEKIDKINGKCLFNYWIDLKKIITSFIPKNIIIIDKIKAKKEEPIKIDLYKRKTEEISENIVQKINKKKEILNNEDVLEKKEEKKTNIKKIK